jgi:hypothetical protein
VDVEEEEEEEEEDSAAKVVEVGHLAGARATQVQRQSQDTSTKSRRKGSTHAANLAALDGSKGGRKSGWASSKRLQRFSLSWRQAALKTSACSLICPLC